MDTNFNVLIRACFSENISFTKLSDLDAKIRDEQLYLENVHQVINLYLEKADGELIEFAMPLVVLTANVAIHYGRFINIRLLTQLKNMWYKIEAVCGLDQSYVPLARRQLRRDIDVRHANLINQGIDMILYHAEDQEN